MVEIGLQILNYKLNYWLIDWLIVFIIVSYLFNYKLFFHKWHRGLNKIWRYYI